MGILIGVSVDFVIHLAHAYSSADLPPPSPYRGNDDDNNNRSIRSYRTRTALVNLGPSILATAITTILSAIVMLFTVINFFRKFALILFLTVIQASAGSIILFIVLVDCLGPSHPTYLFDKLFGTNHPKEDTNDNNPERSERTTPLALDGNPNVVQEPADEE